MSQQQQPSRLQLLMAMSRAQLDDYIRNMSLEQQVEAVRVFQTKTGTPVNDVAAELYHSNPLPPKRVLQTVPKLPLVMVGGQVDGYELDFWNVDHIQNFGPRFRVQHESEMTQDCVAMYTFTRNVDNESTMEVPSPPIHAFVRDQPRLLFIRTDTHAPFNVEVVNTSASFEKQGALRNRKTGFLIVKILKT
jgi:hypothetical protein